MLVVAGVGVTYIYFNLLDGQPSLCVGGCTWPNEVLGSVDRVGETINSNFQLLFTYAVP